MKEIQLFDIKNDPQKVNRILEDCIDELDLELYILAEGNHFTFDNSVILALKKLVKDIEHYIL